MADNSAHSAVVDGVVRSRIVKWRLHDARRENDFIHSAIVVSVYRWRSHAPLGPVHGLADFVQAALEFKLRAALHISKIRRAIHLKGRIVTPLIGVPDLHGKRFELRARLRTGLGPH